MAMFVFFALLLEKISSLKAGNYLNSTTYFNLYFLIQ